MVLEKTLLPKDILNLSNGQQVSKTTGQSEEVKSLNRCLRTLKQGNYDAHHNMMKDKTTAMASILKTKLQGTDQ